jgi:hypothetical protein
MTEATIDLLVESYMSSQFVSGNRYLRKSASHIFRQLLLRRFSIADVKRMSQTDIEAIDLNGRRNRIKASQNLILVNGGSRGMSLRQILLPT